MATATLVETSPAFFEDLYVQADGDPGQVPWDRGAASQALVNWLNAVAPSVVRCGSRVAVAGCGLGRDAVEVIRRGYDVVAFDCSETAVDWARRLDAQHAEAYVQADMFSPPPRWRHRFDLVVEVNNVQALNPARRVAALTALRDLLAPHGRLLVIGCGVTQSTPAADGPPWPLTVAELEAAAEAAGLIRDQPIQCFEDDEGLEVMRGVFRRE